MSVNTTATGQQFDKARIVRIAEELRRRSESKRDFVIGLDSLVPGDNGSIGLKSFDKAFRVDGRDFPEWELAEQWLDDQRHAETEGAGDWRIEVVSGLGMSVPLGKTAQSQLLDRLGVPGRFAATLRQRDYGDVLGNLLRNIAEKEGEAGSKFLVRMLDGKVRAVLSPKYRILDSSDLFFAAAEKFATDGAELWDARLWDDGFELYGVRHGVAEEVTLDRTFDPGDGWQSRWYGEEGDVHNPAVRIRNSDTGRGGLSVDLAVLRRVCMNFCVWNDVHRQIHLGRALEGDENGLIISDATRQKEGELIWSTIGDAITTALDEDRFRAAIAEINDATQVEIDPAAAVEHIVGPADVTEERQASILANLLASGDRSQFGLAQAVTAQAHDLYASDPAEASKLETLGGVILQESGDKVAAVAGA